MATVYTLGLQEYNSETETQWGESCAVCSVILTNRFRSRSGFGATTGCVRAEHTYWRTSWGAPTLEVGKSPTATTWRAELPV